MKKYINLTAILFLFASATFAQKNRKTNYSNQESQFYIGLQTGYSFAAGNTQYDQNAYSTTEISADKTAYKTTALSLGKGINFGLNFGYAFNKYVASELGIGYFKGSTTSFKDTYLNGDFTERGYNATFIQIKPNLVLSAGFSKINPYIKIGLNVGSGSYEVNSLEKYVGNLTAETIKFSGDLALGYAGGLGVNYTLNDKIGLFAEFNFTNMVYAPTKGELTKSTKNGVNQLPSLTISQKEFEYLENFTINGPNQPSNQPRKETKFSIPMNTIGINIGIQYGF